VAAIHRAALDASSVDWLDRDADAAAVAQRQKCREVLKRGQGPDGGWGPYVTSQSEPFDTALGLLALLTVRNAESTEMVSRAREYLVSAQNSDGSWPETTRPPNGESYAQRISTTAWALLALLEAQ
jgi:squalene cyclase